MEVRRAGCGNFIIGVLQVAVPYPLAPDEEKRRSLSPEPYAQ